MKLLAAFLLLILAIPARPVTQQPQTRATKTSTADTRWETARSGVAKNSEYITSAMWALIHTYRSRARMEEALHLIEIFFGALSKDDPAKLQPIGGLDGFFKRFLKLMHSNDQTVAGFSARVLAVTAGTRYEPQIAALLNGRDKSWTDEGVYPTPVVRGQAAIALSIIGSGKYKQNIARLLKSMNEYDRSGAAYALAHLGANEYAPEIAALLLRKESGFRRDESPIHALIEMGVGAQYKKEISAALDDGYGSEVQEAAAYALAKLHATEYSPKIAKLLDDEYRRSAAAKALALMGAKEYAPRIAEMLKEDNSLRQSAALLALGILHAGEYESQVALLMRNKKEAGVSIDAALSLILMGAAGYEKEIIAVLAVNTSGTYVDAGDLHPLVADEAREINQRILTALARFKSGGATAP